MEAQVQSFVSRFCEVGEAPKGISEESAVFLSSEGMMGDCEPRYGIALLHVGICQCRDAATSGGYCLLELAFRIWKADLDDAVDGPDLLKNPDTIDVPAWRHN